MEQTLLDSSKFKIYSLSLDTRFAATNYSGTSDVLIRLPSTYRNIMRVALSSVELPLVEYLFSDVNVCGAGHGNINLAVNLNGGGWQAAAITPGNYDSFQLMAEVDAVLKTIDAGFSCEQNLITGLTTITHASLPFQLNVTSSNDIIAARPTHWGLGYQLGIRTKGPITASTDASGTYFITGTSIILIQPTPYYLLQLYTPDAVENITHCVTGGASVPAFAKLVLRGDFYIIQFVDNGDYMRKEFTYLSPTNISSIRVRLLDPYGALVDMKDMDWSLMFELYEVVNSRTAGALHMNYARWP